MNNVTIFLDVYVVWLTRATAALISKFVNSTTGEIENKQKSIIYITMLKKKVLTHLSLLP